MVWKGNPNSEAVRRPKSNKEDEFNGGELQANHKAGKESEFFSANYYARCARRVAKSFETFLKASRSSLRVEILSR